MQTWILHYLVPLCGPNISNLNGRCEIVCTGPIFLLSPVESSEHHFDMVSYHSFSKTVSGILGSVALSFLIIKRYREPSEYRRSWTVWSYDTSKQVLGMLFVHFANIVWASYISGKFTGDACSLYLLSFLLDSSVGLFIIYVSLKIVDFINLRLKWWMMTVGKYARDERVVQFDLHSIRPWIVQTLIFLLESVS